MDREDFLSLFGLRLIFFALFDGGGVFGSSRCQPDLGGHNRYTCMGRQPTTWDIDPFATKRAHSRPLIGFVCRAAAAAAGERRTTDLFDVEKYNNQDSSCCSTA